MLLKRFETCRGMIPHEEIDLTLSAFPDQGQAMSAGRRGSLRGEDVGERLFDGNGLIIQQQPSFGSSRDDANLAQRQSCATFRP
jgi:hypothetical protein